MFVIHLTSQKRRKTKNGELGLLFCTNNFVP